MRLPSTYAGSSERPARRIVTDMSTPAARIDTREHEAVVMGAWAPGVTVDDAQSRLERATYFIERTDDRAGELRAEVVLAMPATNRTKEHYLRAVIVLRDEVLTSTVELLDRTRGWSVLDSLPAGRAAEAAASASKGSNRDRLVSLRETQMQQLLEAAVVLS